MTEDRSQDIQKTLAAFEELSRLQRELLSKVNIPIDTDGQDTKAAIRELNKFQTKRHTFMYAERTGNIFVTEDEGTDDETTVLIKKDEIAKVIQALTAALFLNESKKDG